MTPDRFHKLRRVLDRRQVDLTVVMENVHKPHNYSAILRSCDATGIFRAHAISTGQLVQTHRKSSASAAKWVKVEVHDTVGVAIDGLRSSGHRVLAAHLQPGATDYREVDYTRPTAVLFGAELDGVSPEAAERCDGAVMIPMEGLVQSLNVSVACAVILFEARRQRQAAGLYDGRQVQEPEYSTTLFEWAHPDIAEYCRRHRRPYPALDEEGTITEDFR